MNSTGTYNSNRLGFRGSEDLGGGLKARFTLETGFFGGTGAQAVADQYWNRESTVGLSGPWGAIDAGRQFSVNARTVAVYDPFRFKYLGIIPLSRAIIGSSQTRFNNDVQYTGKFGDLSPHVLNICSVNPQAAPLQIARRVSAARTRKDRSA